MMKLKHIFVLLFIVILAACSIDVSDNPTATPNIEEPGEEGTTAPAEDPTPEIEDTGEIEPTDPAEGTEEQPAEETAEPTEATSSAAPPAWADLGLTGNLYYTAFIQEQQNLLRLNLETGEQVTMFDPPENAWLSDIALSPDHSQIIMSYGPPPGEGQVQFGFTDLYIMPADGSEDPAPLLERVEASETYYNISWPLQDFIYYAHFAPSTDDLGSIVYTSQIERYHIPSGEVELLVEAAAWPRLSDDGSMMAYVTDENEFTISEADGANPRVIELPTERFPAVDAPLFSPDGETIYFSVAAVEVQPVRSIWDWIMGVKVVEAHNVPSDWWRMPVDATEAPEQLTNIFEMGMYGDFGPDGEVIAFITSSGVQVMNPDGTGVFRLKNIAATGTLNWVP
jgi:Tol biopolymer transport system component